MIATHYTWTCTKSIWQKSTGNNIHTKKALFELFFRKLPFGNGYAIFAGLERIIDYLQAFHFSESDLDYLTELGYEEDYVNYLRTVRFTGTVRAMKEGEIVFGNEPILQVEVTLIEAQLIETALLNIVNYQMLIATKASRIKQAVGEQDVAEFGTRIAHEFDAALWGTRAAYIGGFSSTSNVRAGKRFCLPVSGTHAHSFVQAYGDEYTAFHKYTKWHKDCVFLTVAGADAEGFKTAIHKQGVATFTDLGETMTNHMKRCFHTEIIE